MNRFRRAVPGLLFVATILSLPTASSVAGCPPLPAGSDLFPATTKLVVNQSQFGQPFVVRLSSAGRAETIVERDDQVADTIDTEMVQLELAGFHPRIGPIVLRQSPTVPSFGQIRNVVLDGSCGLAGGDSFFDLNFELELSGFGEVWINQEPVRIEAELTGLPPVDAVFEVPFALSVPLVDRDTLEERGELLYARQHVEPPFPPPGQDCFQSLFTAGLEVYAESTTVDLIGFGPTTIVRGPVETGGYCQQSGGPCEDNFDCLLLDTCVQQNVETEIVAMELTGFDALLGSWELHARPVTGDSDCCESHPTPGCSDPVCEALICALDDFCCITEWDELCAGLARDEPTCEVGCFDPNAIPSVGRVESLGSDATYPADSSFDLYVSIDTNQQGEFLNQQKVPTSPADPITNLPPDPNTVYRYLGGAVPMFSADGTPVGELSFVSHQLQVPQDCAPPVAAGEECHASTLRLELDLPPCPAETVELDGFVHVMRDDPEDPVGFGAEIIDATLASALLAGSGTCNGPIAARLSSAAASSGTNASLTPEEFFPADAFFDLFLELETQGATLDAGPVVVTTTVNDLPPDAGETFHGPATAVDLLDGIGAKVGEIRGLAQTVQGTVGCTDAARATLVFPGPSKHELDVGIPDGGGGVEYDVVRGDLGDLRSSGGAFDFILCLATDVGAQLTDISQPSPGDGFYYLAREGFGAFDGSWNGPGASQVADRDPLIAPCP